MLVEQDLSIDFGQGVDTKTDPKLVVNGKLLTLQNGVFNKNKRVTKRNGYTALTNSVPGGTLSAPVFVKHFQNELVAASLNTLYSYSPTLNQWKSKGKYSSIAVSNRVISSLNQTNVSQAIVGNYSLSVFNYTNTGDLTYTLTDIQNGMNIETDIPLNGGTAANSPAKIVALSASNWGIFFVNNSQLLKCVVVTVSSGSLSYVSTTTVSTTPAYNTTSHATGYQFDVVPTSTGAAIAFSLAATAAGTPISIGSALISTTGVVGTTATITSAGYALPIHLSQGSDGSLWIYWCDNTTPAGVTIYYAVYTSALALTLTKHSLVATGVSISGSASTLVPAYVRQMAAIESVAGTPANQTLYFSMETGGYFNPNSSTIPLIQSYYTSANKTAAGVGVSVTNFQVGVDIYARPFTVGSFTYLPVMFRSFTQATGFLIEITGGTNVGVAGKFLYNVADGIYRSPGYLASTSTISSTQIQLAAGVQTSAFAAVNFGFNGTYGSTSVLFDFNHADAFQGVNAGNTLVLNGSVVSSYDGEAVTELGFHIFPENVTAAQTNGGVMADGLYTYYVVYSYVDLQNNLHQSAPGSVQITTAQANAGRVTLTIPTIALTSKPYVNIDVYRTDVNGLIAYYAGTAANVTTAQTVTFSDNFASYIGQKQIYTTGGIVQNSAPPPSMILMLNQNRVWCVDSENPATDLWYSKSFSLRTGISFSNLFIQSFDGKLGNIKSVIGMDEKSLVLKEYGLFFFVGDGANDSGTGSSISNPQVIPSDVGCSASKATILIPQGCVFKTPKGLYLLNRSLTAVYFGEDVEGFNSQNVTAATMIQDVNQIRLLTSSGYTLVFDYLSGQWSTFSNHQGYSSDVSNGTYVYARTDGAIYQENTTSFLDNATAYGLYLQTSWLKGPLVSGWQRLRRVVLLGDFATANATHGVQIQAAYDFSTTLQTAVPYVFTGSSGVFEYRERLPIQKCQAVQLTIQEITSGATGESIDLTAMTLEAALKKGAAKLSAAQSVG